jgi:hypothetical protein
MDKQDTVYRVGLDDGIPTKEAIESFQSMLKHKRLVQDAIINAALAKRARRQARNLVNSQRSCGSRSGKLA